MKATPFKTKQLSSPFFFSALRAEQGIVVEEPEVTVEEPEVVTEEPNKAAEQMQVTTPGDKDKDKKTEYYKGKTELYNSELDYSATEYGGSSIEDIHAIMEGGGINPHDLNAEQVFDYSGKKMGDHSILGDDAEITDGHGWHITSEGVSNKVFPYGNIKKVEQDDGSYIETINITAKNHPLHGNTYTRTRTSNKERGTIKPIEDLNNVLSNYNYNHNEASGGILGISIRDGKVHWHFRADEAFEEALENGWLTNKDGSKLHSSEEAKLRSEFKKASDRFKNGTVTSTKLNEK